MGGMAATRQLLAASAAGTARGTRRGGVGGSRGKAGGVVVEGAPRSFWAWVRSELTSPSFWALAVLLFCIASWLTACAGLL